MICIQLYACIYSTLCHKYCKTDYSIITVYYANYYEMEFVNYILCKNVQTIEFLESIFFLFCSCLTSYMANPGLKEQKALPGTISKTRKQEM